MRVTRKKCDFPQRTSQRRSWLCLLVVAGALGAMLALLPTLSRAIAGEKSTKGQAKMKWSIAIHGGAGGNPAELTPEQNAKRRAIIEKALNVGKDRLVAGGDAIDVVEAVVKFLEDDPQFNAGIGAVYDAKGSHQLDASIMDGRSLACGAVAGVTRIKNPISLARMVMTETRHVLLAGQGAEELAEKKGIELVDPSYFDTPEAKASWELFKQLNPDLGRLDPTREFIPNWDIGTVGCVVLDSKGNLAAATSTGGITHKQFGRVGDSPIIGAGTFADNATCAVSGTGIGEQYIRFSVAYDIAAQIKYRGATLQQAVDDNLKNRLLPEDGGIIAVDKDGNIVMSFNTIAMACGAADSNGRFEVQWD
jgi:isoaspartyl peptidase/L-asparaginase-like protein (Ntn-hydrolase superfamily)